VTRILAPGRNLQVDVEGRLVWKHELAIDDFDARAERRTTRRVTDCKKQLTAGFEDVLQRIMRRGQSLCRPPPRTIAARPASLSSSTHRGQSSVSVRTIDRHAPHRSPASPPNRLSGVWISSQAAVAGRGAVSEGSRLSQAEDRMIGSDTPEFLI